MQNLLLSLVLRLLKKQKGENKTRVINALLEKIDAFPVRSVISFGDQGTLSIKGRPLDAESVVAFHSAITSLKDNLARKLINEELSHKAITLGVRQALNPEMVMFSQAILYVIQEEEQLISQILDR